jgi:integrator complex subunit 4
MVIIDSICELSVQSDTFANRSVDFLVDMLNDEIDTVRINAINSLRKIGDKIRLQEEQV